MYDKDEDILTIELSPEAPIDHAEQSGSVIVHLSPKGEPVLLEILDASEFLSSVREVVLRGEKGLAVA